MKVVCLRSAMTPGDPNIVVSPTLTEKATMAEHDYSEDDLARARGCQQASDALQFRGKGIGIMAAGRSSQTLPRARLSRGRTAKFVSGPITSARKKICNRQEPRSRRFKQALRTEAA